MSWSRNIDFTGEEPIVISMEQGRISLESVIAELTQDGDCKLMLRLTHGDRVPVVIQFIPGHIMRELVSFWRQAERIMEREGEDE